MRRALAEPGLLGKIATWVGGGILLILGFMFSIVLLAIAIVAGLAVGVYLWWKTRALRRAMREQREISPVIEGESIVVEDYRVEAPRGLPPDRDRR